MSSSAIQRLKEYFERFPGIGPRQSARFVYWLLNEDQLFIKNLSELLLELKKSAKQCNQCFCFYTSSECKICQNPHRDKSSLLIIEKEADMESIEKFGVYNGRYFILGGLLFLTEKGAKKSRLKELFSRIENDAKNGELKEIIVALNATTEGDNTSRYIEKIIEPLVKKYPLKISRFGRGLSTGTELEYLDSDTLKNALENRK